MKNFKRNIISALAIFGSLAVVDSVNESKTDLETKLEAQKSESSKAGQPTYIKSSGNEPVEVMSIEGNKAMIKMGTRKIFEIDRQENEYYKREMKQNFHQEYGLTVEQFKAQFINPKAPTEVKAVSTELEMPKGAVKPEVQAKRSLQDILDNFETQPSLNVAKTSNKPSIKMSYKA